MTLSGRTLGNFDVSALIGRGGMGEVYRAKDLKLGREVAIKVLPEEFARDTDRVARFQREAKLLASLNHPNIAAIHGLEEFDGIQFLVLELVEGETLADQLKRGPIPVEESLKLALQIAEALEAAHEKGVIHRDLKPANLKCTPEGKVKVLDFGLAKAFAGEQADLNLSNSPTLSNAATQQGVILGTAAYMSPEQARGKTVDKKTDIWAFGCVLFEMLTGRAAFSGKDVTDVLAAVIRAEPEWSNLPANLHWRLRELIGHCLEKELKDRYHDISDVRVDIQRVLADPSGVLVQPVTTVEPRTRLRMILPWVAAALVLGAIIAGVVVWNLKKPEPRQVVRFDYELPEGQQFSDLLNRQLAISSDGGKLVFSTSDGLCLRSMDQPTAILIHGSDKNPIQPFFSPDGQWIGYWSAAEGRLKKIAVNGGTPVHVIDASNPMGPSWSFDDTIVYGQLGTGKIMRVSANGGNPELIGDIKGKAFSFPQILPDRKWVLASRIDKDPHMVMIQSLKSGECRELFAGDYPRYLPTGQIIYAVENTLFAVPFNFDKLKVEGERVPIAEGILWLGSMNAVQYAISESGTLAYIPRTTTITAAPERTLVWVDRNGKEEALSAKPQDYANPKISPDGTRVAVSIEREGNGDIWIWDFIRKTMMRLTDQAALELSPLWTPDGKRIAFFSNREAKNAVFWKAADGSGQDEFLASTPGLAPFPASWSNNGKTMILLGWDESGMSCDIGMLAMEGDRKFKTLLKEKYHEAQPQISPDGKWIAYTSNESGRNEVYVRPFPEVERGRSLVSTSGGDSPLWSPQGGKLFYRNGDEVMAVAVKTVPSFSAETPKMLFSGKYVGAVFVFGNHDFATWDISPDGKRFLMIKESPSAFPANGGLQKISIVLNCLEELKQRVPTK